MRLRPGDVVHFFSLAVTALCAMALALYITRNGPGVSPDSLVYHAVAKSVAAGQGVVVPFGTETPVRLTHYPPLYPLFLAVSGLLTGDLLTAGRCLNVFLLGISTVILGRSLWRLTSSRKAIVFGGLFFCTAAAVLQVHAMLWSEPLFLAFLIGGADCLFAWQTNGSRASLFTSALLFGFACATRYAGLPFLVWAAAVVMLRGWLLPGRNRSTAALFVAVGILPLIVVAVSNYFGAGTAANRSMLLHPVPVQRIGDALDTIALWVAPYRVPRGIRMLFTAATALLVSVWTIVRGYKTRFADGGLALWGFCCSYFLFLLISISLFDFGTPMDDRMLVPCLSFCILVFAQISSRAIAEFKPGTAVRYAFGVCLVIAVATNVNAGVQWATRDPGRRAGFAGRAWQSSEVTRFLRASPPERIIYSNAPDLVFFLSGRSSLWLPDSNRQTPPARSRGNRSIHEFKSDVTDRGAAVVVFPRIESDRPELIGEREVLELLPAMLTRSFPEATFHEAANPNMWSVKF